MSETPYYLESIGNAVFSGCSSLENIAIPTSVTSIGDGAFQDCDSLVHVYYEGSESQWNYINIGSDNDELINAIKHCNQQPASRQDIYDYHDDTKADRPRILDYINYTIDLYHNVTITGLKSGVQATDLVGNFIIPDTIEGYNVTAIANSVFSGCTGITKIHIPNSITSLGYAAFHGCIGLTEIEIPSSIVSITSSLFYGCDNLATVVVPGSVTSISQSAFRNCTRLVNITIPKSVTTIGDYAFNSCSSLVNVYYEGSGAEWNNITIGSNNSPLINANKHYNQQIAKLEDIYNYHDDTKADIARIFDYMNFIKQNNQANITGRKTGVQSSALVGDFVIPETAEGYSVKTIDANAFQDCINITRLTIPNSVTSIGSYAFSGCSGLTSISLSEGLTSINDSVFSQCSGLTKIVIPDGVASIGSGAFGACVNLSQVIMSDSVALIYSGAFSGCTGLTNISIGKNVTQINNAAFQNCSGLLSITIPNKVTLIENYAFNGCTSLTDVYYDGTEAEWNNITIGSNNSPLLNATIHYNHERLNLYRHNIYFSQKTYSETRLMIITKTPTPFQTAQELRNWLGNNGFYVDASSGTLSLSHYYPAMGNMYNSSEPSQSTIINGVMSYQTSTGFSEFYYHVIGLNNGSIGGYGAGRIPYSGDIEDYVVEI